MPDSTHKRREPHRARHASAVPEPPASDALAEAVALHRQGALEPARARYEALLARDPDHVDALHLLGVIANQTGSYARAVELIEQAIRIAPAHAIFYASRGNALQNLGRLQDAVTSYDAAILLAPGHVPAHLGRANALLALGQMDRALASYDVAITLAPDHAAAHHNRGIALHRVKRFEEAVSSFDRAIGLKPDYVDAHFGKGIALSDWGYPDAALACQDRAIALRPDFADAHFGRGNALLALRRAEDALASYATAIALRPTPQAHNNAGLAHMAVTRFEAAVDCFDRAIAMDPHDAMAHYNRGNACLEVRRYETAVNSFDRALHLGLDQAFVRCAALHARMHSCDWQDFDRRLAGLRDDIAADTGSVPPFPVLALIDSPALQRRSAETWVRAKHPRTIGPAIAPGLPGKRKIRLAYYSADFHQHATMQLAARLFEEHDRDRFELFAFSFGPDADDAMRQRARAAFDRFVDIRSRSDQEVAAMSRQFGIDIAVDLKGFTTHARPGLFAERCAPIQVSYLGYPATMGAGFIDYLIADRVVVPDSDRHHYSEKLAYLPNCYQPNDPGRRIAETAGGRSDHALPESGFVFCCFNAGYKILPAVFDCWMRIVGAVEGSVLWLLNEDPAAMANLRREAERRGVDGSRLVFAPRLPVAEHLARHRHAGLFLDTYPCNAHTTASDALWAGLVVLTRSGSAFASRVAASLLHALRLPDLITCTAGDYEALAIELASEPRKLAAIKARLAAERQTAPLFDSSRYVHDVETLYLAMIERHRAGLPPDHLYLEHRTSGGGGR